MTPQPGSVNAPTRDVYVWEALLDKGSRCVNEVNVVYQTVYKPQYTPSRDNLSSFCCCFLSRDSNTRQRFGAHGDERKLEPLTANRANSLTAKRNFRDSRVWKLVADVFIVNKCQQVRCRPDSVAPVGDNRARGSERAHTPPRMGTLKRFCFCGAARRVSERSSRPSAPAPTPRC